MIKRKIMFQYDLNEEEAELILSTYKKTILLYKMLLDKRNFIINNNLDLNNRKAHVNNQKDIINKIVYLYKINMIHVLNYLPIFLNVTTYRSGNTLSAAIEMICFVNYSSFMGNHLILIDTLKNLTFIKKYSNDNFNQVLDLFDKVIRLYDVSYSNELGEEAIKSIKYLLTSVFMYMIYNVKNNDYSNYISYLNEIIDDPIRFYEKMKLNNVFNNIENYLQMEFLVTRKVNIKK